MRIIMDLMPQEAAVGVEIVELSGGKVTMLTPPLDFQRYKATLARMNIFVTTDTCPMHIIFSVTPDSESDQGDLPLTRGKSLR